MSFSCCVALIFNIKKRCDEELFLNNEVHLVFLTQMFNFFILNTGISPESSQLVQLYKGDRSV